MGTPGGYRPLVGPCGALFRAKLYGSSGYASDRLRAKTDTTPEGRELVGSDENGPNGSERTERTLYIAWLMSSIPSLLIERHGAPEDPRGVCVVPMVVIQFLGIDESFRNS